MPSVAREDRLDGTGTQNRGPYNPAMRGGMRVSSPRMIGRRHELGRLTAALRRTREGDSRAVVIAGEAGVGKTRRITEFTSAARGAIVLAGGCIDLGEGGVPYAPIVEALRSWVRTADEAQVVRAVGPGRA